MSGAQEVIELFSSSSDEASSIEEEKIQFQSHRRHFKRSNAGHDRNSGSSMSDSSQSSFTIDKGTQSLLRLQRSRQFVAVKMAKVASMRRPRYDEGMQEITEGMNYQELQAQQKMLERLQTQNRRKFYQNGKEKKLEKKEIFKEAKEMSLMKTRSHMHVIKGRQLTSRVEKVDNETKETDAEWAIFLEKAAQRKAARRQKEVEDARSLKKARNKIQHTVPLHANCDHELKKKSKKKLKRKFQTQQNAVKCTTSGRKLRKTLKKNLQKSSSDEDFEVENDLEKQEQSEKNKSDEEEREPTSLQRRKKRHQESEKHRRPYTAAPVSKRQRIDVEMAAESEVDAETTTLRSNRTIETHLIKEKLTFLELQEQEKLMAFFKAQKRRRRPLMSLIGNCNDTGSASGQDDENDVAKFTKAKSMHVAQTNGVAKTAFDAPTNSVARRARMGVSETPEATSTLSGIASPLQNGFLVSNKNSLTVAHAKSSKKLPNPVIHSTAWRRLLFKIAPANILDVSIIPYAADFDRPLWDYDRSKKLRTKCSLVDTKCVDFVSRKKQFKKQCEISYKKNYHVSKRVIYVECAMFYKKLASNCLLISILTKWFETNGTEKSSGRSLHVSTACHHFLIRDNVLINVKDHQTWLDVSSIERITAKRKLQQYPQTNLPYNSLVGDVQYWIYRNKCPHDFHVYPETVAYLPNEISAICRSFTMIGIRKNVFVEDDPILTYVPYLGDGERLVIENNLYTATTIGKERRMAEFGEGEELKEHTRSCRESDIDECLLRVVVNICGGREQAFKALEQEGGMQRPRLDYDELIASNKTKARIASQITKVKECINSSANKAVNPACQALRRLSTKCWFLQDSMNLKTLSLPMKLQPPVSVFESNYGQSPEALGLRDRTTFDGISEWYRDLFCRRCFIYDCIEHGIQNPQRRQREDPVYPMMTVPSLMHIRHELVDLDNETDHQKIKLMTSSNVDEIVELCLSSSDDEVQETTSLQSRTAQRPIAKYRRSRRTQTRISSLATNSLITQEKMVESERLAKLEKRRKRRKQFRQSADNSEYLDNSYLPAVALRMKTLASKTHPCGSCCWIGANPNESISCQQVDTILVRKIASALGPNACVIAAILKSPSCTCAKIWRLLTKDLKRQERGEQLSTEVASSAEKQRKKGRKSAEAGVTCPIVPRVRNAELSTERERKVSFKPCNHDGLCDVACGCMKRGHACNRTCSCSRDCRNRFQGCKCFVGNCHTSACPCWSAGRECDPDFCFTCGASDAAVVAFHALGKSWGSNQLRLCHNVNMLLGSIQKNVGVSFSSTHGWGAFALEPISKDEFVLEYTGELISDEEAERRGAMYDRKSISYLFGVNSEYVVDAARKGNKAKFANHKAKKEANLDVRIIVSNGEHRIGLFANETIEIGAELFFDYGYTHDSAPTWSQHHKPISEKGVYAIVDEENEWEQWE
ncbi:hypothetical protein CCR75_006806 [Bremia lactucae]|uniref:Uncharacterized protein n=1 Tax=Bremia lactucae TaxID=4779 RepID=A0A976FM30_BRELC|nr:hypothetical protein CCR75_006806 [Bremia lactucae]